VPDKMNAALAVVQLTQASLTAKNKLIVPDDYI
jgi:hypothetical protein